MRWRRWRRALGLLMVRTVFIEQRSVLASPNALRGLVQLLEPLRLLPLKVRLVHLLGLLLLVLELLRLRLLRLRRRLAPLHFIRPQSLHRVSPVRRHGRRRPLGTAGCPWMGLWLRRRVRLLLRRLALRRLLLLGLPTVGLLKPEHRPKNKS